MLSEASSEPGSEAQYLRSEFSIDATNELESEAYQRGTEANSELGSKFIMMCDVKSAVS